MKVMAVGMLLGSNRKEDVKHARLDKDVQPPYDLDGSSPEIQMRDRERPRTSPRGGGGR